MKLHDKKYTNGNIAATRTLAGRPLLLSDKLVTSWWTAAFAIP